VIPIKYTYRNLFERRGVVFMTLASIGFVVLVYVSVGVNDRHARPPCSLTGGV